MKIHLYISGLLMVLLSALHIGFPRYFQWKKDLAPLSLINRQMMEIHTFFIGLTVLLMGLLCVGAADDLLTTALGKTIALGLAIFWSARWLVQFFGYSASLWKGKRLESIIHCFAVGLWSYFCVVFWLIWWR